MTVKVEWTWEDDVHAKVRIALPNASRYLRVQVTDINFVVGTWGNNGYGVNVNREGLEKFILSNISAVEEQQARYDEKVVLVRENLNFAIALANRLTGTPGDM